MCSTHFECAPLLLLMSPRCCVNTVFASPPVLRKSSRMLSTQGVLEEVVTTRMKEEKIRKREGIRPKADPHGKSIFSSCINKQSLSRCTFAIFKTTKRFLVVSHDSIRGCVHPSVSPSVHSKPRFVCQQKFGKKL